MSSSDDLPSWYRGGKREFLGRVRRASGHTESISQLDVRPDRLALAFKLDPWVEEVRKVIYAPGRIFLDLKIREPVAWVKPADGQPQIVDGEGRVLPAEDVDVEAASGLLRLTDPAGLSPPSDRRPGVVWKSRPQGADPTRSRSGSSQRPGWRDFLKRELQAAGPNAPAALRMIEIILSDVNDFRKRGLIRVQRRGNRILLGPTTRR